MATYKQVTRYLTHYGRECATKEEAKKCSERDIYDRLAKFMRQSCSALEYRQVQTLCGFIMENHDELSAILDRFHFADPEPGESEED